MPSPRRKLIFSFAVANLLLVVIATTIWMKKPATPPQIQGVLLAQSKTLGAFSLIDHHNKNFTNRNLLGQWHLVSYGFTTCPDVCPTTLSTLVNVIRKLESEGREPLSVLFYTVDHRRDTASQLSSYMPFFHSEFLGLTHFDDAGNPHLPFEQGLGIFAMLTPKDEVEDGQFNDAYDVSHGVTLFLLNPQGQLQAIFEPGEDQHGTKVFNSDQIYSDYLQIRHYFDQPSVAAALPSASSAP